MNLLVEEYNEKELEGKKDLPNRFLEVFQPSGFEKIGYPIRVNSDDELWKYIDVMHELRLEEYYKEYGITYEEFELLKKITSDILNFSKKNFNKSIIAKAPIINAINLYRQVDRLYKFNENSNDKPKIFEIGLGSGYLAAILHMNGYKVYGTDVTQGFYMFQNKFLNFISENNVYEMAYTENDFKKIKEGIVHIPYWKLYDLKDNVFNVDIFVANGCLCEMSRNSLLYYLALSKEMLKQSKYKLFVFQDPGACFFRKSGELVFEFYNMGYKLIHSDNNIIIFTTDDQNSIDNNDLIKIYKENYFGNNYIENNNISKKMNECRKNMRDVKKVPYDELIGFYRSIIDEKSFYSPDEVFLKFIGYNRY